MKKILDIILNENVDKGKFSSNKSYLGFNNSKYPEVKETKFPVATGDRVWGYSKAFKSWVKGIVAKEIISTGQLELYAPDYAILTNPKLTQKQKEDKTFAKFWCEIWQVGIPEGTPHPVLKDVILPLDYGETFFHEWD